MLWYLQDLIKSASTNQRDYNGIYIPARPLSGPFIWRLKSAWLVLIGKADAVIWPEGQ